MKYTGTYLVNFFFVDNQKGSLTPSYTIAKFSPYFPLQLSEKCLYLHPIIKKLLKLKVSAAEHKIISIAPKVSLI